MTKVRSDMSVSLDGYVCGPKAKDPPYLDEGFFRVTSWATELATWRERRGRGSGTTDVDDAVVAEMFAQAGAYVMGRRMFDSGEEPWGESAIQGPGVRGHPPGTGTAGAQRRDSLLLRHRFTRRHPPELPLPRWALADHPASTKSISIERRI